MKTKFLALAAFTISFFTTASAQELTYGVKVGMNVATISCSEGEDESKALIGLTFGGTAHYSLNNKASISTELLFSQQGWKFKYTEFDVGQKLDEIVKYRSSYLNIPILCNYLITDKLSVKSGMQLGFLILAKERWIYNEDDYKCIEIEDTKKYYNSIDFAIPLGLSYDITDNIYVDARYNIGISNFVKDSGDYKFRNNVFALSLGYKF